MKTLENYATGPSILPSCSSCKDLCSSWAVGCLNTVTLCCLYQCHTCTSSHAEASMRFEIKAVNEDLRSWHGGRVVAREGVFEVRFAFCYV